MPDEDVQDVIDLEHQYVLLTAAIGGDALAHMACESGMKTSSTTPNQWTIKKP